MGALLSGALLVTVVCTGGGGGGTALESAARAGVFGPGDDPSAEERARTIERGLELSRRARTAWQEGRPAEARVVATEGLALLQPLGEPTRGDEGRLHAEALARLGAAAADGGDFEASARALEQAIAWGVESPEVDGMWLAQTRGNLAMALKRLGRIAQALEIERELVAWFDRRDPEPLLERVISRMNLSQTLGRLGEHAEAVEWLEAARPLAEGLAERSGPLLEILDVNLAANLRSQGELTRPIALMQSVLARRRARLPEDHPSLLGARLNLARLFSDSGRSEEARRERQGLLAAYERIYPPHHPMVLAAREEVAKDASAAGDLAAALVGIEDTIARHQALGVPDLEAYEQAELLQARILRQLGALERSRSITERIVAAREQRHGPEHPLLTTSLWELSLVMHEEGDSEGALVISARALERDERAREADDVILWRNRQGHAKLLHGVGRVEEALELRLQVREALGRLLDPSAPDRILVQIDLADSLSALDRGEEALALLVEAQEDLERFLPEDHPWRLTNPMNIAALLASLGRFEESADALAALWPTAERRFVPGDLRRRVLSHNLALTLTQGGSFELARAEVGRLVDEFEAYLVQVALRAPREARAAAAQLHGRISLVVSLAAEDSELARAFELAEHTRRIALAPPPLLREGRGAELVAELAGVRRLLGEDARPGRDAAGEGDLHVSAPVPSTGLAELALRRDRLERELRLLAQAEGSLPAPILTGELARRLGQGSALVSFLAIPFLTPGEGPGPLHAEDRLLAHVLRPDGTLARVDLGPVAALESEVEAWRSALGRPVAGRGLGLAEAQESPAEELEVHGHSLRRRLLDPLAAHLADARRVWYVADGPVFLVPLGALPEAEGGRVGEQIDLVQIPALRPGRGASAAEPGHVVLLGGVDYAAEAMEEPPASGVALPPPDAHAPPVALLRTGLGTTLAPLPGTRAEIEALAELARTRGLAVRRLEGRAAGKASLFALAPGASVLHLATHGWFLDPTPASADAARFAPMLLAGLALAGADGALADRRDPFGRVPGLVTAEELAALDLSACDLAVLSACETHVGLRRAGQGIQSLQAALHQAGARTALTSLWKVDDVAARELMERFYAGLWTENLAPPAALARAQAALIAAGRPARDWAAWVLSADGLP